VEEDTHLVFFYKVNSKLPIFFIPGGYSNKLVTKAIPLKSKSGGFVHSRFREKGGPGLRGNSLDLCTFPHPFAGKTAPRCRGQNARHVRTPGFAR